MGFINRNENIVDGKRTRTTKDSKDHTFFGISNINKTKITNLVKKDVLLHH